MLIWTVIQSSNPGPLVMTHVPREMRNSYDISVEDATRFVARREVDTAGAKIVVNNLTNDVRGTWRRLAASPQVLVQR